MSTMLCAGMNGRDETVGSTAEEEEEGGAERAGSLLLYLTGGDYVLAHYL